MLHIIQIIIWKKIYHEMLDVIGRIMIKFYAEN